MNMPSRVKRLISTDIVAYNIYATLCEGDCLDRVVEKSEIAERYGYSDRQIRKAVSKLREAGLRVASSSHRPGYWICRTPEEYAALRAEFTNRIQALALVVRRMDEVMDGQIEWDTEVNG